MQAWLFPVHLIGGCGAWCLQGRSQASRSRRLERLLVLFLPVLFSAGMAAFVDRESSIGGVGPPVCTGAFLFGCELNSSAQSYTFKVSEEDDSTHILALNTVFLSEGAKDECNIIEVVGRNYHNEEIAVPVANLKLSCQPVLSLNDFQLQPPVTFRLRSGSGPVHLAGLHQIFHRQDLLDDELSEEDDFSEEDEVSDEEDLSPVKPAKKKKQKS